MNAHQTYQNSRAEIDTLLADINRALTLMDEVEADHPLDWGWAGNAGHVKATLAEVLEFIEPEWSDDDA